MMENTSTRSIPSAYLHLSAIFLIVSAVAISYSNTLTASFHLDDVAQIFEDSQIRGLEYMPELLNRPRGLAYASFALNYSIGGLDVAGFHAVNILIHIVNGILAYYLIFLTLEATYRESLQICHSHRPYYLALFSSLLFVVHPVQTQAVTYIIQRMEIMASMFYLIAILMFIKGTEVTRTIYKLVLFLGVTLAYILGLKSKEVAITIPVTIFLYDLLFLAHGNLKEILRKRWHIYTIMTTILIYFIKNTIFQSGLMPTLFKVSSDLAGHVTASSGTGITAGFYTEGMTSREYLLTQFNVLMTYLRLLIFPFEQNLDYDYPLSRTLLEPRTILSSFTVILIISISLYLGVRYMKNPKRKGRLISFFSLWFFVILSPTSSFVPIMDVIAEHRVYLASLGFMVVFAIFIDGIISFSEARKWM